MIEGFRFIRGLPRHAIVPGVDVVDGSGKRIRKSRPVLLVDEPTNRLLRHMKERGIEATIVGDPKDAAFSLAAGDCTVDSNLPTPQRNGKERAPSHG